MNVAPGDLRLPEKVDLIIMTDMVHRSGDRDRYFRGLRDYRLRDGKAITAP